MYSVKWPKSKLSFLYNLASEQLHQTQRIEKPLAFHSLESIPVLNLD